jgi:hypothetical protein
MAGIACAMAAEMKDALAAAPSAGAADDCTPEPNSTIQRASGALKPSGRRPQPAPAPEGAQKPAAPTSGFSAAR